MLRAIQSKLLKEGLTERSNSQEIVDFQISFQMIGTSWPALTRSISYTFKRRSLNLKYFGTADDKQSIVLIIESPPLLVNPPVLMSIAIPVLMEYWKFWLRGIGTTRRQRINSFAVMEDLEGVRKISSAKSN